jgi:Mce-associated membrane protein
MTVLDKLGNRLLVVKLVPAVLVLLVLASAALTTWLYFSWYRPDKNADSNEAAVVVVGIDEAREGTVAMLSYAPETVDSDLATAKSHLTGDFLSYYETFARQVVSPASKQKALTTTAEVVGAGVVDLHSDSAAVLVFVNQTTTSKEHPEPAMAARSVQVSLSKVDGNWLIAKFDPV